MMTNIHMTRHAKERAAQRLPRQADLDLILQYADHGKHQMVVTQNSVRRAELDAIAARRRADRIRSMNGLHLPLGDDGRPITLERLNKRKSKRVFSSDSFN